MGTTVNLETLPAPLISLTYNADKTAVTVASDYAGTLKSSENEVTINGAAVGTSNTDASIVSAGDGVSSILGLADGDSVTVPNDTSVQMPGTTADDTDTAITINGKTYLLGADTDGVAIKAGADGDTVTGLAANASLTVGAAGTYNVNDEVLEAKIGDVIIGDAEGSAHIYDPSDVDFDSNTSTEDIVNKILKSDEELDRYVENLNTDEAAKLAEEIASGDLSNANGNIQMMATNPDTSATQNLDFTNTTGIKKVSLEGGNQDVSFNDAGGNIALIPKTDENADGEKNVNFGDGGDLAVVEEVAMQVNFTFGKGRDTLVTKGRHVRGNLINAGPTTLMPTGGRLTLDGYDATKGQSIQSTLSNIFRAVKINVIKLADDIVTMDNGAEIDFSGGSSSADEASDAGARVVNFKNIKGLFCVNKLTS